jgi:hypothetical protein
LAAAGFFGADFFGAGFFCVGSLLAGQFTRLVGEGGAADAGGATAAGGAATTCGPSRFRLLLGRTSCCWASTTSPSLEAAAAVLDLAVVGGIDPRGVAWSASSGGLTASLSVRVRRCGGRRGAEAAESGEICGAEAEK